jgi:hypothetical protein
MDNIKKTIFTDSKGQASFLRVGGFIAIIFGVVIGLAGVFGFFFGVKDAAILIAASEGLITLVLGAKAWQKVSE